MCDKQEINEKPKFSHKQYYQDNKERMNYNRKCCFALNDWKFLKKEDCDFWFKHRPVIKSIYRNKNNMDKKILLKLIEQIYDLED